MTGSSVMWLMLLGLIAARASEAAGPGDDLLKLVAPDAAATLVVEDLRGQARDIAASPLFDKLRRLPSARAWMASERFRAFDRASRDIQALLGVSIATIRDDLLGDSLILSLQAAPSGKPEQSQGLLLVKPRDRALIERLIRAFNEAQVNTGELDGVDPRTRGRIKYSARLFKGGVRPPEFYVLLDDGTFAWSNSESIIHGVIDRKLAGGPGLWGNPAFQKVRRGLPDRPLVSLFVDPRFLERAMAGPPRPVDDRAAAMLGRYLGAVDLMGVSLHWGEGLTLQWHEAVASEKLDPWLKDWMASPAAPVVLPSEVSSSTVAVLGAHLDYRAIGHVVWELMPDRNRPDLDNLKLAFQGILLGQDPVADIGSRLSPGAVLAIEIEPDQALRPLFPIVVGLGWSDQPGVPNLTRPIDNAIRTMFALFALNPDRRPAHLRVESKVIGNANVTSLTDGFRTRLASRVDRDRVFLGTSTEAVSRAGTGRTPSTLSSIRARHFPEAETFAIVDLPRVIQQVKLLRGPIARVLASNSTRPIKAVDHDLGDLIALAELFQAATFTSASSRDADQVHRSIGLRTQD